MSWQRVDFVAILTTWLNGRQFWNPIIETPSPGGSMPRDPQALIFVGIKHAVVAIDARNGSEVWRAELRSGDYVTVLWDGEALIAANAGEVWRLDPATGAELWRNQLKGMGRGLISLASNRLAGTNASTELAAQKRRRDAQHAAAAAGA
ncbi:MAG TPA: PQQ-binding-like beta-propeller repeat protein [Gemmatimonadaceae bacterium]|nr:PQQ-binding-like beta-propeller repeat protein [Gemmatimonadaceae bacterium]